MKITIEQYIIIIDTLQNQIHIYNDKLEKLKGNYSKTAKIERQKTKKAKEETFNLYWNIEENLQNEEENFKIEIERKK